MAGSSNILDGSVVRFGSLTIGLVVSHPMDQGMGLMTPVKVYNPSPHVRQISYLTESWISYGVWGHSKHTFVVDTSSRLLYNAYIISQLSHLYISFLSLFSFPPPRLPQKGPKTPHNVLASKRIWRACPSLHHTTGGPEERSRPNWPCSPNGQHRPRLPRDVPTLSFLRHQLSGGHLSPTISKPSGLPPLWSLLILIQRYIRDTLDFKLILHPAKFCTFCWIWNVPLCVNVCNNTCRSLYGSCQILHCSVVMFTLSEIQ